MNTRYHCPACRHRSKTFSRYIAATTGRHIAPEVGRCSRESNCGYHYTPRQYFAANGITNPPQPYMPRTEVIKHTSYIPPHIFKASLAAYNSNCFTQYLTSLFGAVAAGQAVARYCIGTSRYWHGATAFWQVDGQGRVRTGKVMLYNPTTGRRVKQPYNHITWAHTALKLPDYHLQQCLYGEHLLPNSTKTIAIAESEKTAIIGSICLPQYTWLAAGSLTQLTATRCSILKGRTVHLFPDLNAYDKWTAKARELAHIARFSVSDLLERNASEEERRLGLDVGDYLVRG